VVRGQDSDQQPRAAVPATAGDSGLLPVVFGEAGKCGAKKGGVDELGKLRRGAKRNGAILTFFAFERRSPVERGGTIYTAALPPKYEGHDGKTPLWVGVT
jgi:hypothetical protein